MAPIRPDCPGESPKIPMHPLPKPQVSISSSADDIWEWLKGKQGHSLLLAPSLGETTPAGKKTKEGEQHYLPEHELSPLPSDAENGLWPILFISVILAWDTSGTISFGLFLLGTVQSEKYCVCESQMIVIMARWLSRQQWKTSQTSSLRSLLWARALA